MLWCLFWLAIFIPQATYQDTYLIKLVFQTYYPYSQEYYYCVFCLYQAFLKPLGFYPLRRQLYYSLGTSCLQQPLYLYLLYISLVFIQLVLYYRRQFPSTLLYSVLTPLTFLLLPLLGSCASPFLLYIYLGSNLALFFFYFFYLLKQGVFPTLGLLGYSPVGRPRVPLQLIQA